jgi:hypothetical protein
MIADVVSTEKHSPAARQLPPLCFSFFRLKTIVMCNYEAEGPEEIGINLSRRAGAPSD